MRFIRGNPNRPSNRSFLLALVALLALLLAACGGAEEDAGEEEAAAPATEEAGDAPEDTATEATEGAAETEAAGTEDGGATEAAAGSDMSADELPTFRLANQENLFGLNALVAADQGYFDEHGVNVEMVFNPSGAERAALVIGGTADASILGAGSGMRGFETGDWRFVGTMVQAGGANALSCDPELGFESVADLKGSGVGLAAADGSGTYLTFLEVIAPEFGLTPDDWELVNLPTSDRLSAVAGGSAGCMLNQEPILTQAEEEGLSVVIEDGIYEPYDPSHQIIYVRSGFLDQEGGDVATERFLAALVDAKEFIESNPEQAAEIYISQLNERGIDVAEEADTVLIGVEKQGYDVCIGEEFRTYLEQWGEIQVGLGELSEVPDFDENVEWELNERATGGCS